MIRFLGAVTMVAGILLVAEAAVTLAWQEPISAAIATRSQAALGDDLDALEAASVRERAEVESDEREAGQKPSRVEIAAKLARAQERRLGTGDAVGEIALPTQDRSYTIVEGTGTAPLRKGPGHYEDTPLPGRLGTFAVAGHRTTYLAPFRDVNDLERGDPIVVEMPYATFHYDVEKTRIVTPDTVSVKRSIGRERLVLTACHPLYSAAERIVVFAELDRFELHKN